MFGFPIVEHKKFEKNFLKTVIFQLDFDYCDLIHVKSDEIEEMFKDLFPRFSTKKAKEFAIRFSSDKDASFKESDKGHVAEMRSLDGKRILTITENNLTFIISGDIYESFQKITLEITKIISCLSEIYSINTVNKVAIRKINIIEFKLKEDQKPIDILTLLLNPNIIGNMNFFPNKEKINHKIQSLNYNDGDKFLNIKYGLNLLPSKEVGQVIIDIDLFERSGIVNDNIISKAKDINSEIFNVFNWIISDDTLSLLES